MICLDSSILIEYFRKSQKENSTWYKLSSKHQSFAVSVITAFEVLGGATAAQKSFWDPIFQTLTILPFDMHANEKAIQIYQRLKSAGNLIDLPDLFIAATAIAHELPLATLNTKHFERITKLILVEE